MKFIFYISLPFYLLDQWSKHWILRTMPADGAPRNVIPDFFNLVHVTNNGAAFGSFKNNNTFFVGLSCVALLVIVTLLVRRRPPDRWRDISLALLLAGVLGNLSDRLLHGHVIDFLLVDLHFWPAHPWPAFNVADSCICVAVVFFVIHSLMQQKAVEATETL